MKRIATAAALTMLALPASAAAAESSAIVHAVNYRHQAIEIVCAGHVVRGYSYHGKLPKLHAGAVILFRRNGMTISRVSVSARPATRVTNSAQVVRSSHNGPELSLANGQGMRFLSTQLVRKHLRSRHDNPMAHIALGVPAALGHLG